MPRIRRGGGRLRSSGARTRNEECCCEIALTCSQIQDDAIRSLLEVSLEFNGLTLGTDQCSTTCSDISLASVLDYQNEVFPSDGDWVQSAVIGCTKCSADGVTRDRSCKWWHAAVLRCTSDVVRMQATIRFSYDSPSFLPVTASEWTIEYQTTVPVSSFFLGTVYTLPRTGTSPGMNACFPTSHLASTCDIVFSYA